MDTKELITEDSIDIPSNRDYLFEDYLQQEQWEWQEYPRPEDYYRVLNQWATPMCSLFWKQAIINGYQIIEDLREVWHPVREQFDPSILWVDNIRALQIRVDNARKAGEIEWYLSIPRVGVKTPSGIMTKERRNKEITTALNKGFFIYTGTEYSRWTMKQSPILTLWDTRYTGHIFSIIGADHIYQSTDSLYKFVNSYWIGWGNKGYGYIKEDNIDKLFTCYVIIPKTNSDFFKRYRANKKVMELIGLAKQIYNENKDNKSITRYFETINLSQNLQKLFKI